MKKLCYGLDPAFVDPVIISQKVITGVYPGVTTSELDELAAQTAAYMATQHPEFSVLAARIAVSNLHKSTHKMFSEVVEQMRAHVHPKTGEPAPLVAEDVYDIVMENKDRLNSAIIHDRDFEYVAPPAAATTLPACHCYNCNTHSLTRLSGTTTSASRRWSAATCSSATARSASARSR